MQNLNNSFEIHCTAYEDFLVLSLFSGGLFGATMASLVSFPFDVVRTRVIAQPTTNLKDPSSLYYTNTRNALLQVIDS